MEDLWNHARSDYMFTVLSEGYIFCERYFIYRTWFISDACMFYTAVKILTSLGEILPSGRTFLPSERRNSALHIYAEYSEQQ